MADETAKTPEQVLEESRAAFYAELKALAEKYQMQVHGNIFDGVKTTSFVFPEEDAK